MHLEVLTDEQLIVLEGLRELTPVHSFYLAGGTALALRHGHRRSIDFDFFRQDAFDTFGLASALDETFVRTERLPSGEHTLHVRLEGVSAPFFQLPYCPVASPEPTSWGFTLATDEDIAAMKLEAITGRGSRKDFVDLYLLCERGMTLEEAFELFERRYGTQRTERYHRLRALAFFEDAEQQPMPDMLVPIDWNDVSAFFAAEASRLLAEGLSE